MSDPTTSDVLVAEIRECHVPETRDPNEWGPGADRPIECESCHQVWPCAPIRMADALESALESAATAEACCLTQRETLARVQDLAAEMVPRPQYAVFGRLISDALGPLGRFRTEADRELDQARAQVSHLREQRREACRRIARLRRACRTLGRAIDRQCLDALAAIGQTEGQPGGLIDADGDGDWMAVWDLLAELLPEREHAIRMRDQVRAELAEGWNSMGSMLGEAWDDGNAKGLDGWIGPGRGAGEVDQEAEIARERCIRSLTDPLRPPKPTVPVDYRIGARVSTGDTQALRTSQNYMGRIVDHEVRYVVEHDSGGRSIVDASSVYPMADGQGDPS